MRIDVGELWICEYYLVAVVSACFDGEYVPVGLPDDPVDRVAVDVDAEEGRITILLFQVRFQGAGTQQYMPVHYI